MKTILGSGQLGMAVLEALLEIDPGTEITMVNRSGKLDWGVPKNVRVIQADVTNIDVMKQIAQYSECIYSCTDVTYQKWDEFYPAIGKALSAALSVSRAKLIFADNLYSYGNVKGAVMNEELPHQASTKKGMIRANLLKTLLYSGQDYSRRVAIVKAADFIGPRIHKGIFGLDFLDRLTTERRIILSGEIDLAHTFTYIKDLARAMVNVSNAADAFGQIWHAPNATAMDLNKWIHLFEVMTNNKARVVVLPKFVVRIAGFFNSLIKEFYELAYQFEYPYLVDHSKYTNRFGDHSTPPSIMVKETIQWYNFMQNKK